MFTIILRLIKLIKNPCNLVSINVLRFLGYCRINYNANCLKNSLYKLLVDFSKVILKKLKLNLYCNTQFKMN